ncbi:hypothetical protein R8Z50_02860 [Longispora sp. K20-0274]|uniref:hypothetical protein n=1 Tax=Longispora sp. K20-0274 TaxID=3088255 RepID=UPI00399C3652
MDRTRLEFLIRVSGRSVVDWCAAFNGEAAALREPVTLSVRQLQRWVSGSVRTARPAQRRVAVSLWKHPFGVLVGPPTNGLAQPLGRPPALAADVAARASARLAGRAWSRVDQWDVERLRADVHRLVDAYPEVPPLLFLADAGRARENAITLLEGTEKPAQLSELYLVAAQLSGLMSSASFDMADWGPAVDHARAAYRYAELIDHSELVDRARGHLALMSVWTGGAGPAVVPVAAALADRPGGVVAAGFRCAAARAWVGAVEPTPPDPEPFIRWRQALGGARWLHDQPALELRERIHELHRQTMVNGA